MIHIRVPGVPPTTNHAYVHIRKANKRVLSKEGQRYQNETIAYIAQNYSQELKFFQQNRPYSLIADVTFKGRESLICNTWPEKAKFRYQKLDASNRVKLFEDAFAKVTGIDDSHYFFYGIGKFWHVEKEEINVWVWCCEEGPDPIDEFLRNLRASRA